jgi:hypothetical protein
VVSTERERVYGMRVLLGSRPSGRGTGIGEMPSRADDAFAAAAPVPPQRSGRRGRRRPIVPRTGRVEVQGAARHVGAGRRPEREVPRGRPGSFGPTLTTRRPQSRVSIHPPGLEAGIPGVADDNQPSTLLRPPSPWLLSRGPVSSRLTGSAVGYRSGAPHPRTHGAAVVTTRRPGLPARALGRLARRPGSSDGS